MTSNLARHTHSTNNPTVKHPTPFPTTSNLSHHTQHPSISTPYVRCLRFGQILLGWKTYKHYETDATSPTQGQPNPRKIRLKVAFGPLFFPQQKTIFRLGWDWLYQYIGNRLQETQPNYVLRKHRNTYNSVLEYSTRSILKSESRRVLCSRSERYTAQDANDGGPIEESEPAMDPQTMYFPMFYTPYWVLITAVCSAIIQQALRRAGWVRSTGKQSNGGSLYRSQCTAVEGTHSHLRNPAWTPIFSFLFGFPVNSLFCFLFGVLFCAGSTLDQNKYRFDVHIRVHKGITFRCRAGRRQRKKLP